jgi:hypothetical protein
MNSLQNNIYALKRIYWAIRENPVDFITKNKLFEPVMRGSEILKYALMGKANSGYCPICEKNTAFIVKDTWLRDNYLCARCRSIPRVRHIMHVLQTQFPKLQELSIHESSPSGPSFVKFRDECKEYVPTYFWPDVAPGLFKNGYRCENLENLTFPDASFDIVITQDVMEHVMNPIKAFSEIARTLKPGGAHIFTVPWYKSKPTFVRARETDDGEIEFFAEKEYHGNPIDKSGALVVTEWGIDLPEFIFKHSGLVTTIYFTRDRQLGLTGEFIEVFVSRKPI